MKHDKPAVTVFFCILAALLISGVVSIYAFGWDRGHAKGVSEMAAIQPRYITIVTHSDTIAFVNGMPDTVLLVHRGRGTRKQEGKK